MAKKKEKTNIQTLVHKIQHKKLMIELQETNKKKVGVNLRSSLGTYPL